MDTETRPLHVFFFPYLAQGHMIPMVDMARLFASHGVHSTIVTTPLNSTKISKTISNSKSLYDNINVIAIPFPAVEVGLPEGCENSAMLPLHHGSIYKFRQAIELLQKPLENLLEQARPDCLISDLLLPWTVDSAVKFNIPRIVFQGTSFFAMCAIESLRVYKPYKSVSSDAELFCIPNLPDEIKITRTQYVMNLFEDEENGFGKVLARNRAAELRSYGMIVNSFVELEPSYVEHYKNVLNRKAWCVGPVSLWNRNADEKDMRGKESTVADDQCLKWLDNKNPDSVVYICFGSGIRFPNAQLRDIALGLELTGKNFIWVIRKMAEADGEDNLPEGFEERVKDRGLLIRGWAPQVLILGHPSVGGFVTHCGWNSTLEGITAGLPMVTWPLSAEQFLNEKLVTDVLGIGVGVGTKKWSMSGEDHMEKEKVAKAVRIVMEGDEGEEMRKRARQLGKMAKKALERDGSSNIDLRNIVEDLKSMRDSKDD